MRIIENITNEDLQFVEQHVKDDPKYGREGVLIDSALRQYPYNNDIAVVSMKICLIDLTNGTNLMRNLGTDGGLYDLAKRITEIGKNLFSFISKYCLYHNVHCYDKDDFVIYDSVLAENINKYITDEEFKSITGKNLYKNSIKKYRNNFKYEDYKKIIDFIIKKNNITVSKAHRKMDWFIWYKNRPIRVEDNKPLML